jgi:plasmid stabilization system protein ParE
MVEIRWTNMAMNDLYAAREYAAANSPAFADRLVDRLISRVTILENFPEAGRIVPEFARPNLRELPERNFRIVYRIVTTGRIDIIRVHPTALPLTADFLL